MRNTSVIPLAISVVGIVLTTSLFLATVGANILLAVPGELLLGSYHFIAFFIPLYLFCCAYLTISQIPSWGPTFLFLNFFWIPFFTLTLLIKVLIVYSYPSPAGLFLQRTFGPIVSLSLLGTLFILECLFGVKIFRLLPFREILSGLKRKKEGALFGPPTSGEIESSKESEVENKNSSEKDFLESTDLKSPATHSPENSKVWEPSSEAHPQENIDNFFAHLLPKEEFPPSVNEQDEPVLEEPLEKSLEKTVSMEPSVEEIPLTAAAEDLSPPPQQETPAPFERDSKNSKYAIPVEGVLTVYKEETDTSEANEEIKWASKILQETLREFSISAQVTGVRRGPVITLFELLPAPGVRLSRIVALADNIALRLAASRVRIVAPIPGKHAVGIEVPNRRRAIVSFRTLLEENTLYDRGRKIPIILGRGIGGEGQTIDLAKTPHLLIAGATGSGKSVCVNALICSLLYRHSPEVIRMILIDPKIVELKLYNDVPHLLTPVITDPKRALQALQWTLHEMDRRYTLLDSMGVRDIHSYNKAIIAQSIATTKLPYLIIVIDEFADLMASSGKNMEAIVARLAAMSRAVGIHLVLATQRPSIDVITGLIKANFPSRIAFMVASKTDSRIIIDSAGADTLLGRGDMLFTSSWEPFPTRIQGAFLSEQEVLRVAEAAKMQGEPQYIDEEIFFDEEENGGAFGGDGADPLFDEALEIVTQAGKASASYLQRRLKIGYNRAARLIEEMEDRGIVGSQNGSKPRSIIHIP